MKEVIKNIIIKFFYPFIYKKSFIYSWVGIKNKNIELPIMIGKNTIIYNDVKIGKYTSVRNNVFIDGNTISIGRYCSIANDVSIGVGNHPIERISTSDCFYYPKWGINLNDMRDGFNNKKTVIGNDVWIGTKVVVLSGIKIGTGAIIGAGSIVTKDIPDYAIVVGVPAKIIKFRFDNDVIQELLNLKWWELDENFLMKAWELSNIKDSINYIKKVTKC
jgi:acetyltransferase-like isoleucine patch superfamily enzyme